jgi:hypothetical protein
MAYPANVILPASSSGVSTRAPNCPDAFGRRSGALETRDPKGVAGVITETSASGTRGEPWPSWK